MTRTRILRWALACAAASLIAACSLSRHPPVVEDSGVPAQASAAPAAVEFHPETLVFDTGDIVKVSVFQSPDMTTETRVDEAGNITLPLISGVQVRGLTPRQAETRIAEALERGQFLKKPQVTVTVVQFRSQQVSVLGNVNRPGRYPLDLKYTLSDMVAMAGGVSATGADTVVLSRRVNGAIVNREIDLESMYAPGTSQGDPVVLQSGDTIYVHRAPMCYVHGEVQRPGSIRVERGMTFRQAVAAAGGLTQRGTMSGLRVRRKGSDGTVVEVRPDSLDERVQAEDVVLVRESLF